MADYQDKVINAEPILPGGSGGAGVTDDGLFHTENTPTVSLAGDGTLSSPLKASVNIDPVAGNALTSGPDGLSVGISALPDNLLTLAGGKLYIAPPQVVVEISKKAGNIITNETTPGEEGLYAEAVPGPEGKKGEKGDPGTGIYVLGVVSDASQLPDPTGQQEGDTYIVGTHYYTIIFGNWIDLGDFAGPAGADGIGLVIKGSFASAGNLPSQGNTAGDAYIIQQQMFVWDGSGWSPVGQVGPMGPEGKQGKTGPVGPVGPEGKAGKDATIFTFKGIKGSEADLPTTDNTVGDAWAIGQDIWVYDQAIGFYNLGPVKGVDGKDGVNGKDGINGQDGKDGAPGTPGSVGPIGPVGKDGPPGPQGDDGLTAYEVAVVQGFTGTVQEWLKSLIGKGIQPKGEVPAYADLPATGNSTGDMYYAENHTYIWDGSGWVDFGDNSGPPGVDGKPGMLPEMPVAIGQGTVSQNDFLAQMGAYVNGTKPADPVSYSWIVTSPVQGADTLACLTMLPTEDGMYLWISGPNIAGDGAFGNQFGYLSDSGYYVNITNISASSTPGQDGKDGKDGVDGINGQDGHSVLAKGYLDNTGQLPASGNSQADMYYVAGKTYIWDGSQWVDMGVNIGPTGSDGQDGKEGKQGPQGEQGSLWIALPGDPSPAAGRLGDYYVDTTTLAFYQKTTAVQWSQLGYMGGGNVFEAPVDGTSYVRRDQGWIAPDVIEAPDDGKQYVRKSKGWAVFTLPTDAVTEAPINANLYARSNGSWVTFTPGVPEAPKDGTGYVRKDGTWTSALGEAPTDGGFYGRQGGAWSRLNRLDVPTVPTVTNLDASKTNAWNVDLSTNRNLTINNLPTGRTMALTIKFTGNGGTATWTNTINWIGNVAPTYSPNATLVVLHWDGTSLMGTTPGGY